MMLQGVVQGILLVTLVIVQIQEYNSICVIIVYLPEADWVDFFGLLAANVGANTAFFSLTVDTFLSTFVVVTESTAALKNTGEQKYKNRNNISFSVTSHSVVQMKKLKLCKWADTIDLIILLSLWLIQALPKRKKMSE